MWERFISTFPAPLFLNSPTSFSSNVKFAQNFKSSTHSTVLIFAFPAYHFQKSSTSSYCITFCYEYLPKRKKRGRTLKFPLTTVCQYLVCLCLINVQKEAATSPAFATLILFYSVVNPLLVLKKKKKILWLELTDCVQGPLSLRGKLIAGSCSVANG